MQRFAQVVMILASLAALVSTVQPATAGKYCLQGRQWGFPDTDAKRTRRHRAQWQQVTDIASTIPLETDRMTS